MSDTPRTDALREKLKHESDVSAYNHMEEHARELERELAREKTMHASNVAYLTTKCEEAEARAKGDSA